MGSGAGDLACFKRMHAFKRLHSDWAVEKRTLRTKFPLTRINVGMNNRVVTELLHEVTREAIGFVVGILDGQKFRNHDMKIHVFVAPELLDLELMSCDHRAPRDLV